MLTPSRGLSDTAGGIPRNCLKDALRPQKPYILDRIWRNGAARWNAAPQGRIDSNIGNNRILVPLQREFEQRKNELDILLKELFNLGEDDHLIPQITDIYGAD